MRMTKGGMPIPETHYARADDGASIAYQVYGSGPYRYLGVPGAVFNCDVVWDWAPSHHYFQRLGSFCTVAHFDKRGTGCSDRLPEAASIEQRMEDIHVVMDAVGWDRATISGLSEGGPMACLFAATYPERTERLVLAGTLARFTNGDGYDAGFEPDAWDRLIEAWSASWGTAATLTVPSLVPSMVGDPTFLDWMNRFERASSTPAELRSALRLDGAIDVRHVLGSIQAPTLVLRAHGDPIPLAASEHLASHIPHARLVTYDGDHIPAFAGVDHHLDAVEQFMTGTLGARSSDRVLATVLFTDIVESTARLASVGDQSWRQVLDDHDHLLRGVLDRHGGTQVKATGDGLLATFDSPTRAVRAAEEIVTSSDALGLAIRAGLHTGEVERRGSDIAGIAVHIGARVAALAGPGEVLVSAAVPPLVVGSDLEFADRGTHELKGVPGTWSVMALVG